MFLPATHCAPFSTLASAVEKDSVRLAPKSYSFILECTQYRFSIQDCSLSHFDSSKSEEGIRAAAIQVITTIDDKYSGPRACNVAVQCDHDLLASKVSDCVVTASTRHCHLHANGGENASVMMLPPVVYPESVRDY